MNRPLLSIVMATLLSAPYHSSGAAEISTFHNINKLPFRLTESQNGPGDIRINGAYYSRPWQDRALIFSAELKFPTGDYDRLTGSGVDRLAGDRTHPA